MQTAKTSNASLRTPAEIGETPFKHVTCAPLTDTEAQAALQAKYSHTHALFPQVERAYVDPAIPNQAYALVSFVPSEGATPDTDGVYGCMKIRGVYPTVAEADERAEFLIRSIDSNNSILTTFVGRPFPIMDGEAQKYGAELKKIDMNEKAKEILDTHTEKKGDKERRDIEEIKQREKKLLEDVKVEESTKPPEELYTTLRVKLGQLVYTAFECRKRLDMVKPLIVKAHQEVMAMEAKDAKLKEEYMDRYSAARKDAGIPEADVGESFMTYMIEENIDLEKISQL